MRFPSDPVLLDILRGALDIAPTQSVSVQDYWPRLRSRLQHFGISRVADITGLDRLGFPVAQAVRPLARSNAVTQGKAQSLEGAAIGAVLECLEMAAGEQMARFATSPVGDAAFWSRLAPGLPDGTVWPDAQTEYVACWNLTDDCPATMPRDLISTDFTQDAAAAQAPILRHSIGLGAGTGFAAAVAHGLLECIEADARIRAEARGGMGRLALSAEDDVYGPVLRQIEAAGLRAAVHDLPCKGGVLAVQASIMEAPGATSLPLPATGFAARMDLGAAIAAALAEAAQARLAVISGAREDITQRFYAHDVSASALDAEWARHGPAPSMRRAPTPPASLRESAARVGPVLAVPLHWDAELPLAIVRIVTPDLIADPLRLAAP